jgi:hypothetical protein
MPRPRGRIKILRKARIITVKGGDEVYTRFSKKEYENRREAFDDPDFRETPYHLQNHDYDT